MYTTTNLIVKPFKKIYFLRLHLNYSVVIHKIHAYLISYKTVTTKCTLNLNCTNTGCKSLCIRTIHSVKIFITGHMFITNLLLNLLLTSSWYHRSQISNTPKSKHKTNDNLARKPFILEAVQNAIWNSRNRAPRTHKMSPGDSFWGPALFILSNSDGGHT